jgi:hypothetical protein
MILSRSVLARLRRSFLARLLPLMLAVGAVLGVACASDTPPPASAFIAEAASAAAGLQRWYEGTTYRSAQWWLKSPTWTYNQAC